MTYARRVSIAVVMMAAACSKGGTGDKRGTGDEATRGTATAMRLDDGTRLAVRAATDVESALCKTATELRSWRGRTCKAFGYPSIAADSCGRSAPVAA